MRRNLSFAMLVLGLSLLFQGAAQAARPWRVVLPDTVQLQGGKALLRDLSTVPVPAGPGQIVICVGASPNTIVSVSRQIILRKLVTAGLSSGVSFQGPDVCQIVFAGRELNGEVLLNEIRRELQDLVPTALPGAPDSWFEVEYGDLRLSTAGDWRVELNRRTPLNAGRNLIQVRVISGDKKESFSASVILHSFGETARAARNIRRDTPVSDAHFTWQWQDLAELPNGLAAGRGTLAGASTTHSITAGEYLREADLQETPLIMAGDPVELVVMRGQVAVTVRAFARQQGCLGQTIPVRNELTGRLVNARIAGPGRVEWRR
ncbi:MAG: flagellar basal body P-ring formation chaperone FlgA [Candidatus Krumholzibacteria bacterium]|nr:flagellar basal body P-ring formation chaperone FlgA [Candidatus Krumholzibacteria bacterium]